MVSTVIKKKAVLWRPSALRCRASLAQLYNRKQSHQRQFWISVHNSLVPRPLVWYLHSTSFVPTPQILSRSRGKKNWEKAWDQKLRHGPEMVDSVSTKWYWLSPPFPFGCEIIFGGGGAGDEVNTGPHRGSGNETNYMAIVLFTGLSISVCVFSQTINRRPGNEAINSLWCLHAVC